MADRVHIHATIETRLDPDRVIAALTDFTDQRPGIWPALDPARYELHELGDGWALATEGSREPAVWARERYDWGADWVSIKAEESNFCVPGDGTDLKVRPGDAGGSILELDWEREAATPEWQWLMDLIAKDGEAILTSAYHDPLEALFEREQG